MRQIQEAEQPKERRRKPIRFWNPGKFYDFTLLFLVIFLVGFGLVMVYSASSYTAALDHHGDSAYFLKRQAVFAVLGLAVMFFVSLVDYHILKKFTVIGFLVISALLLVTMVAVPVEREKVLRDGLNSVRSGSSLQSLQSWSLSCMWHMRQRNRSGN